MSTYCSCDTGIGQLFVGGCKGIVDITDKLFPFARYDKSGNKNYLSTSTSPIPAGTFAGKLKAYDTTERWHLTPTVMNPTWEEADAENQSFDGGINVKLSDGAVTMTVQVINVAPQEVAKYKTLECGENDVMIVTQSGQLIAYGSPTDVNTDHKVYGLPVQSISVKSLPMKTNASTSLVTITIVFKKSMNIGYVVTIDKTEITEDLVSMSEPKGVTLAVSGTPTTSQLVLTAKAEYYGISGYSPIVGLALTDFYIYDVTSSTAITPSGVVELPDGTYTFSATFTTGHNFTASTSSTTATNITSNTVTFTV